MFVTFEGIDGSGKSTQLALLERRLKEAGHQVFRLREPGGTPLSERIRTLLLDPELHIDPFAELLLFSAARAQLVQEAIRPALARGEVVLCDRFFDSTTAYQGAGRKLTDMAWLGTFHLRVTQGMVPDRTYLLDVDPEVGRRRMGRREGRPPDSDRMERSGSAFYERVANGYRQLAALEPGRVLRLDGSAPVEEVHDLIWKDLRGRLGG